jgi:hypothetical protein
MVVTKQQSQHCGKLQDRSNLFIIKQLYLMVAVFCCLFGLNTNTAWGQSPVLVTDKTLVLEAGTQTELFYGFAAGDQILLHIDEADQRPMSEVEVVEMPNNSIYQVVEKAEIAEQRFQVTRKQVYKFRLSNTTHQRRRTCRIVIKRIPAEASVRNFNTAVRWITQLDTMFSYLTDSTFVGYKKQSVWVTQKTLVQSDTQIVQVLDRVERVHAVMTPILSPMDIFTFRLPDAEFAPNEENPYRSKQVIAWAYAIGVDKNGAAWYKDADSKAAARGVASAAVTAGVISTGFGALAVLAMEGYSTFSNPPAGENIRFAFYKNGLPIQQKGNAVTAFGRETRYLSGPIGIRLLNDNLLDGVNVHVKIAAVELTQVWEDRQVQQHTEVPIYEYQVRTIPQVKANRVPVCSE